MRAESCLDLPTSWGVIRVVALAGKVKSCDLPLLPSEPRKPMVFGKSAVKAADAADTKALKAAEKFVRAAFAGKPGRPPAFHWPEATPFTTRVWRSLVSIPRGETLEYGELARRIGRPGGSRAVGRACGSNPLPLFIPCHRVLPKDGSLGGFSSGLPWKRLLLEQEKNGSES